MNAHAWRRRWPMVAAALALLAAPVPAAAGLFGDPADMSNAFPRRIKEAKEGEILVRFRAAVPAWQRDAKHMHEGNAKLRELRRTGVHLVQVKPSQTVEQALARYRADTIVEYAEPNYIVRPMRLPNEPAFNLLWSLQNTGQTLGSPGADIKVAQAWDLGTGSAGVAVMVIDTGIDTTHPDLAANVWVNPGEIPGNGIDDDGNGYIDDMHGIDVVNGDGDPMDDHGHGTHVAGTIGAAGNNGQGVAGVNWTVKLIGCKLLDAAGTGTVDKAVECLEYARALKARGVNIVATNNSYGGLGATSATLREAIDAQRDILFVAAAGNFGIDNDANEFFPANFDLPNVISVAATDHHDALAAFSSRGRRSVHLGAPGVSITSTIPFGNYTQASGTSMAAPHVAGTAALLKSQEAGRDWRALRNLLLSGGEPRSALATTTASGRRLDAWGAATCNNRPLFTALKLPASFTVGVASTVSAVSVNCANAVGPVTATSSAGETFTLRDDGMAPDLAAGDGIFSASWTPLQAFSHVDIASAAGSERISVLDLTVAGVSAPPAVNRGDPMRVDFTIANPSSTSAPAAIVNLYLSADGVITTGDPLLGSFVVPPLAGGTQQALAATVAVPGGTALGNYFIGAIVDPDNQLDEGSEINNSRAGNVVGIGNLAVDLAVPSVSAPTDAFVGDPIAIAATVRNLGSTGAGASTLNFYLSADAVITSGDILFATAPVAALAGGASVNVGGTVPLPASLPAGTWYVGAIADASAAVLETNEVNNTGVAAEVLTASLRDVDLTVTAVGAPGLSRDQEPLRLDVTVRNLGGATAPASTVRWYLSSDAVITTDDVPLASASLPSLNGGAQKKLTVTATAPAALGAGSYTIGALVDPDNTVAETRNDNNGLAGNVVAVSYSVDLAMNSVSGPATGATGQNVTLSGTVRNTGLAASPSGVVVGFYLSSDATVTSADNLIGTTTLPSIAAGATLPVSMTAALRTGLAAGAYHVGAVVDPGRLLPESSESNNALAGNTLSVSYGPDLVITTVSAPTTAARGKSVLVNATLFNQGIGAVGALTDQDTLGNGSQVRVGFYMSSNPTVTAADTPIGSVTILSISPGQSIPLSVSLTIPSGTSPGTYYIGAIADFSQAVRESNEVNNAKSGNATDVKSR